MRMRLIVGALLIGAVLFLATGCDIYTSATVNLMDTNAGLARAEANKANQNQLTPAQMAYDLEVFARGYENLSAAGHFKKPVYTGAPTTQPTTLPWTPTGGANPNP